MLLLLQNHCMHIFQISFIKTCKVPTESGFVIMEPQIEAIKNFEIEFLLSEGLIQPSSAEV